MKKQFSLFVFKLKSKSKSLCYIQTNTCIWKKALLLSENGAIKKGSGWGFFAFLQLQCPN